MHNTSDGRKFNILDIFKLEREGEAKIFNPNKLHNKKLLWHGSRFSNFVGILSNGMRIAPPEAPKTGYAFGKGVYFADLSRKSAPYCCPYLSNGVGLFVVCEVALGEPNKLYSCNHDGDKLPKGTHSTLAVGCTQPDPKSTIQLEKTIDVPLGKPVPVKGGVFGANEYVVYNTN